jgi:hypothetical protein
MPVIQFDPALHRFTLDGEVVPGVSSILKAADLGVDYSGVPPAVLEYARMRGHHIDACCTLLDQGVLDWESVAEEAKPYVDAWDAFKAGTGFRPTHQQPVGYHPELNYCGIPDCFGFMGRTDVWCVDRKATDRVYRSYGLQLAGYTMPCMVYGDGAPDKVIAAGLPITRAVVQLKKDGTFKVYAEDNPKVFSPDDWDTFKAACVVARWKAAA